MTAFQALERLTLIAPLGLRFSDEVTGSFIGDGSGPADFNVALRALDSNFIGNQSVTSGDQARNPTRAWDGMEDKQ